MASRFFQTLPRDQELAGCSLHAICKFLSGVAFSTQVQKSKLQGKWVDVLFMHALASACKVDIAIYWNQHTVAQHLVGTSLFSEDAEGIVPLVLAENFHWWAAVPMESDPVASVAVVNKLAIKMIQILLQPSSQVGLRHCKFVSKQCPSESVLLI